MCRDGPGKGWLEYSGWKLKRWYCQVILYARSCHGWSIVQAVAQYSDPIRRKGRALDNIFVERLWRMVKYENMYLQDYDSPRAVRQGLTAYLEAPIIFTRHAYQSCAIVSRSRSVIDPLERIWVLIGSPITQDEKNIESRSDFVQ